MADPAGLSPRGRGNPDRQVHVVDTGRSIPAWAGQPSPPAWLVSTHKVYPRVGGATSSR